MDGDKDIGGVSGFLGLYNLDETEEFKYYDNI